MGFTYEIRADYEDETFEVVSVPADSIGEAIAIVERDPSVVGTTLLCSIDSRPQSFLAW